MKRFVVTVLVLSLAACAGGSDGDEGMADEGTMEEGAMMEETGGMTDSASMMADSAGMMEDSTMADSTDTNM
jgi:hypothetical protein